MQSFQSGSVKASWGPGPGSGTNQRAAGREIQRHNVIKSERESKKADL